MESIKFYLAIIDPFLLNQLSGKPREFIRLFKEYKPESEEAFIEQFCGSKKTKAYYQLQKSRTIKILEALAIVSGIKARSEVKKKYDICLKKFTIGQKFLNQGIRKEGLRQIKQAYRIAIDFSFTHLVGELSSILHYDSISYHSNSQKAKFYAKQTKKYIKDYLTEKEIESYLFQVIGKINSSTRAVQLEKNFKKIQQYSELNLKGQTYKSMIEVLYGFSVVNYPLIIKRCEKALNFLAGKKGVYSSHYHFFLANYGIAQIANKSYAKAKESFSKAEKKVPSKSINRYVLALYKTITTLHAGDYSTAYQLYRKNRKCKFENVRQQFAIIEAYLCFLSCQGYLQLEGRFRIGKYLNETFKSQSDKQGSNVAILIAELLVYLARDRGKFIDRVEAINNYSYRHLKGEETKRAKRFIKILCLLPRANFNAIALKRIAARPIDFLNHTPICMGQNVAIEIIPFEDLLKMIMQTLAQKVA